MSSDATTEFDPASFLRSTAQRISAVIDTAYEDDGEGVYNCQLIK